jgi:tetratricopeptide (TPR) repeat protein
LKLFQEGLAVVRYLFVLAALLAPWVALAEERDPWIGKIVLLRPGAVLMNDGVVVDSRLQSMPARIVGVDEDSVCLTRGWAKTLEVMSPEEALAYCEEQLKADPKDVSIWRLRGLAWKGIALRDEKDYRNAIYSLDEALRINPKCAEALADRGHVRLIRKEYASAQADLSAAIQIDPTNPVWYVRRAALRMQQRECEDAKRDCDRALQLDPDSNYAYSTRGDIESKNGERKAAIADYSEAIRCNPRIADAYGNRALCWLLERDADNALHDLDDAIRLQPKEAFYFLQRGCCWFLKNDGNKAVEDMSEFIRLHPNHPLGYVFRAYVHQVVGSDKLALDDFETALRFDPKDTPLLCDIAWLLATSSDVEVRDGKRAVEFAKKACELTEWKRDAAISALAAGYATSGDWNNANHFIAEAISKSPDEGLDRKQAAQQLYKNHKPLQISALRRKERFEVVIATMSLGFSDQEH